MNVNPHLFINCKSCPAKNALLIAILIPLVFELRQGPLLVLFINLLAQEIANRSLTPSLINDLTFVLGFRHFPTSKEMWLSVKNVENVETTRRQVQFETGKTTKQISYTDMMRVKIDSSSGRRELCQ